MDTERFRALNGLVRVDADVLQGLVAIRTVEQALRSADLIVSAKTSLLITKYPRTTVREFGHQT